MGLKNTYITWVIVGLANRLFKSVQYNVGDGWDRPGNSITQARLYTGMYMADMEEDPGMGGERPELRLYTDDGVPFTIQSVHRAGQDGEGSGNGGRYRTGGDGYFAYLIDPLNDPDPEKIPPTLTYLSIRHCGEDPVCVAGVSIQAPDNSEYHIMGDLMHQLCKWYGYPSYRKDFAFEGTGRRSCFWVGGYSILDEEADFPNHVWMHLPDLVGFQASQIYSDNPDMVCRSEPRLHGLANVSRDIPVIPLIFWPEMTYPEPNEVDAEPYNRLTTQQDPDRVLNYTNWARVGGGWTPRPVEPDDMLLQQTRGWKKRSIMPRNGRSRWHGQWSHTNSTEEGLSAEKLCADPSVVGPDVANSHERKFCHFTSRKVLPYCDTEDQMECYDIEAGVVRASYSGPPNRRKARRSTEIYVSAEVKNQRFEFD